MQCQILYHTEGTKALQTKGFSNIEEAEKWMNDKSGGSSTYTQNARIVVDYAAVEVYQEMYDLMKEQLFGNRPKPMRDKKTI